MADGILNPIPQLEADIDFEVYTKQEVDALLDEKADKDDTYTKTETDALLDAKADADSVYTKTETDALLDGKADKSTTLAGYGITDAYTKTETDGLLSAKADANDVYTKVETDNLLNGKADASDVYTKTETDNLLNGKADTSTTLAGYGITDAYTKSETDTLLGAKANADDVYTKTEIDNELTVTKDGSWVKTAQTTATNLEKLESGLEYAYAILSKQYDQLKKYVNGNYYDFDADTDAKYVKNIPANAMPYASIEMLGGKTLVWNQLLNAGTISIATTDTAEKSVGSVSGVSSHKYLFLWNQDTTLTSNTRNTMLVRDSNYVAIYENSGTNHNLSAGRYSWLVNPTTLTSGTWTINYWGHSPSNNVNIEDIMLIDLTLMFGAGNEPTTVQEFQQMFPASYYSYNAGTLLSAGVTEVKSVGKNVLDMTNSTNGSYDKYNIPNTLLPNVTYTYRVYGSSNNDSFRLALCENANGSGANVNLSAYIKDYFVTFTTPADTLNYPYLILRGNQSGAGGNTTYKFQVEKGSKSTDYAPYFTDTYPIPASIQALEGYGWSAGSVYNYVDFERKVFVQKVARVDLGSLTWSIVGTNYFACTAISDILAPDNNVVVNAISVPFHGVSYQSLSYTQTDAIACIPDKRLIVGKGNYADGTAFQTAMNGVYLYYELATPIETDISAYLDDNTISVESGGTLTFPNQNGDDYRVDVPSEEEYLIDLSV